MYYGKRKQHTTNTPTRDNIEKLVILLWSGDRTWNLRDGDTMKSGMQANKKHESRQCSYFCFLIYYYTINYADITTLIQVYILKVSGKECK